MGWENPTSRQSCGATCHGWVAQQSTGGKGVFTVMVQWWHLNDGTRPVPEPAATPVVWTTALTGAFALVSILDMIGALSRPAVALGALSSLAALTGLCARFAAAPGTAGLCWLCLNAFAAPPVGQVDWVGHRDTAWLACLLTAAVAGTIVARIVNARAAYRRITPGTYPNRPPG